MGKEWLLKVLNLLSEAGIAAGEEFAAAPSPVITKAVATVGLRNLDLPSATVTVMVRIISPRTGGGWACQITAAAAVGVLEQNGLRCTMGNMEYRCESDCFELPVTGKMLVPELLPEQKPVTKGWWVTIDQAELSYVTEFSEHQDQHRRLIGDAGSQTPSGITPGVGGWEIRLIQTIPVGQPEPEVERSPFSLTVYQKYAGVTFSGCVWNEIHRTCQENQIILERRGLATGRKEEQHGLLSV